MEFAFTEEQAMIADTVRAFFAENATSARTRAAMKATGADAGFDRALWHSFASELGLAGVGLPEDHGGAGLGILELALVAEAAGAHVAAMPLLGLAMVGRAIAAGGSDVQKSEWLPGLANGDVIAAAAWGEGLHASGGLLSGTLSFVPHGGAADILLVYTGDDAWLVDLRGEGVVATNHVTMDQTRPLATIVLTEVGAEPLADGTAAMAAALAAGWLCLAAEALGGAQAALDRTVAYSRERVQFGRPIGSFQAYKHRLADMMIEIEQARSAVYWAACAIDEGSDEATLALHAAKAFCADTYHMCAGNMIQLHGGIGFTWEHDAHLYFKRARSIMSMLGDSQWHREQVARLILGAAA
ncbi:acyl-CoA dehydrogenase family protein [Novosphingobium sp.]|uniref:acyl-CoA dehydrogenase family protein n=1 Tax=Novosphingobium sp. TaxID=1874826 RepID=UPI0038B7C769